MSILYSFICWKYIYNNENHTFYLQIQCDEISAIVSLKYKAMNLEPNNITHVKIDEVGNAVLFIFTMILQF